MIKRLEQVADRLLNLVVPHTTAAAQNCWYQNRCEGTCYAAGGYRLKLLKRYHCCQYSNDLSVCLPVSQVCGC
jgi:hypothetical protein